MNIFIISVVRTIVPVFVGAVSSTLLRMGLDVPAESYEALGGALFVLFTGVYYILIRLLEEKFPNLGVMLGFPKSPDSYSTGPGVVVDQKPNGNPEITVTVDQGSMTTPLDGYTDRVANGPDHRAE